MAAPSSGSVRSAILARAETTGSLTRLAAGRIVRATIGGGDGLRMSETPWMTRRHFLSSAALLAAGSLLVACQQPAPPPPSGGAPPPAATQAPAQAGTAPTLKIGAVMGLTGRYASLTEQVKNGYELAFADLNKASKLQLELKMLDDESDATKTVQRVESLYSGDNVLAFLGGAGSDLHAAAAAVADKDKTPYIGVAFALLSVHQKGLRYLFSPFPKSPALSKTIFEVLDTMSPFFMNVTASTEK